MRLLTGTTKLHRALERDLAALRCAEAALDLGSGHAANFAAIPAVVDAIADMDGTLRDEAGALAEEVSRSDPGPSVRDRAREAAQEINAPDE